MSSLRDKITRTKPHTQNNTNTLKTPQQTCRNKSRSNRVMLPEKVLVTVK